MGIDECSEVGQPRVLLLAPAGAVEQQRKPTAWSQHSISAAASRARNQWNASPTNTASIDASGGRQVLCRSGERLDLGQRSAQQCPHLVGRLYSDHVTGERFEPARQLAGAGGQVEHDAFRSDPQLPDRVCDRRLWVRRPRAVVGSG